MIDVERYILGTVRRNIERKSAALLFLTVKKIAPFDRIIGVCKAFVIEKFILVGINFPATNRAVTVFHLKRTGVRRSVGEEKTVNTKCAVVLLLTVVAAVGIFIPCVFVINAMVCKFPNTSAEHIISLQKRLYIHFKVACAQAHCVSIFAHIVRLCVILLRKSRTP